MHQRFGTGPRGEGILVGVAGGFEVGGELFWIPSCGNGVVFFAQCHSHMTVCSHAHNSRLQSSIVREWSLARCGGWANGSSSVSEFAVCMRRSRLEFLHATPVCPIFFLGFFRSFSPADPFGRLSCSQTTRAIATPAVAAGLGRSTQPPGNGQAVGQARRPRWKWTATYDPSCPRLVERRPKSCSTNVLPSRMRPHGALLAARGMPGCGQCHA